MAIAIREWFESSPAKVRRAIENYVSNLYPAALNFVRWDSRGTHAEGRSHGASVSLDLVGKGPTELLLRGTIGLPARLFVSERRAEERVRNALEEIKRHVP